MSAVQEWINNALAKGCLSVDTYVAAYDTLRKFSMTYKYLDGKALHTTYPDFIRLQSTQGREARTTEQRTNGTSASQRENNQQVVSSDAIRQHPYTTPDPHYDLPEQSGPVGTVLEDDQQRMMTRTFRMLDTAQNDRVFYLLCGLIDESGSSLCSTFAACAMDRSVSELRSKPFIQDVLEYSRGKHSGVKDPQAHLDLKERIEMNVAVLKATRSMYGLPSYEDVKLRATLDAPESTVELIRGLNPQVRNFENDAGRHTVQGGLHGDLNAIAWQTMPE